MTKETQFIDEALTQLEQQNGIRAEWHPRANEVDGELTLYIGRKPWHAIVEAKRELRQYQLQDIISLARQHKRFMVIAERIFPAIKAQLREEGIGYLDKAGEHIHQRWRNLPMDRWP